MSINYFIAMLTSLMTSVAFALPNESPNLITHSELVRVISGLFFILLIIVLLSWVVKRFHGTTLSSSKGFQSIASMTLGPKERMMLIKVGERYLLMGVATGSVTILHDFGQQLPPGFDMEYKPTFAEILKSAVGKS